MALTSTRFTVKNGHPQVVFEFDKRPGGVYRPHSMSKNQLRFGENTITIPFSYFWEFADVNKDGFGNACDLPLAKDSVDCFYGYCLDPYDDKWRYSAKLTKKFLERWADLDCPKLVRFEPNCGNSCNMLGMSLPVFETVLYECGWYDEDIADDITEEEMAAFDKYLDNTWGCYERLRNAYNDQHSDETPDIVLAEIEKYESEISEAYKTHEAELKAYSETLPERVLDCGFAWVETINSDIDRKLSFLQTKGIRNTKQLEISYYNDYMSVDNTRKVFEKFLELNPQYKNELLMKTMLD